MNLSTRTKREQGAQASLARAQKGAQSDLPFSVEEIAAMAMPLDGPMQGVYFLISGGNIVYVGKSVDVAARIRSHANAGIIHFDMWSWLACEPYYQADLERDYLDALLPKYNLDTTTKRLRGDNHPFPSVAEVATGIQAAVRKVKIRPPPKGAITDHDVVKERMRRLRAMKADHSLKFEDFGPMPVANW